MLSAPAVTVTRLSNFPARGRIGCPRQTNARQGKGVGESSAAGNFASQTKLTIHSFLPIASFKLTILNLAIFSYSISSSFLVSQATPSAPYHHRIRKQSAHAQSGIKSSSIGPHQFLRLPDELSYLNQTFLRDAPLIYPDD